MNDLVREVSPLTRAIVWLRPAIFTAQHVHYKPIDYLLDGLLTATIKSKLDESTLLVGENFNRKLYIFVTEKAPKRTELESFFSLLEKDIKSEDRILVVDDVDGRESFLKLVPEKLLSHFHVL